MDKSSAGQPFICGIDLGTTNSAIAMIGDGIPNVVPNADGEDLVPSVVLIDPADQVVVGRDARSAMVAMPDRTIAAVKRKMGSPERLPIAGKVLTPQEVSALILRQLKTHLDPLVPPGTPIEAVITVPAYFNEGQRRATKEAGELAGFKVERIINEPTAAALAFGFYHLNEERTLLVYDLGGGTFDVSVISLSRGVLEVQSSTGNRQLGGEDFDWKIVEWMAESIQKRHGVDPRADLRARALMKEAAERLKWELSEKTSASASIPVLMTHEDTPIPLNVRLTRSAFEQMIAPWLDETIDLVEQALAAADVSPEAVDDVLLVGGSTRIPDVSRRLKERFERAPRTDVDPDLAVALGAAVQAGLKAGQIDPAGLVATDVAPFSMGIAVAEPDWMGGWIPGFFKPIIAKNAPIPATATERFAPVRPEQTEVRVEVYQGEAPTVYQNYELGSFLVTDLPVGRPEEQAIDVTFHYDLNGMLDVTARSVRSGKAARMRVQDALDRQSEAALQASAARLEALWNGPDANGRVEPKEPDSDDPSGQSDWDEAVHEAHRMIARLEKGHSTKVIKEAETRLKRALEGGNLEELLASIDGALDALIDAEW